MALEAKRATMKMSIMKISKFSKSITDAADEFELETLLQRLDDLWQKYETVHMSILDRTGPDNLDFERIEFNDTENTVIESQANFKRAIKARKVRDSRGEENS